VWVEAGELVIGEEITQAGRGYGVVQSVWTVGRTQAMWDLTVNEAHTFFVGEQNWLVHNCEYDLDDLGRDFQTNGTRSNYRLHEAETGSRLADDYLGDNAEWLVRHNPDGHPKYGDWIDSNGTTYDAVTAVNHPRFDVDSFEGAIYDHMVNKRNIDYIVIDNTNLNPQYVQRVVDYTRNLNNSSVTTLDYIGLGPGWTNFK
jgi:hypothetical protein